MINENKNIIKNKEKELLKDSQDNIENNNKKKTQKRNINFLLEKKK